MGATIAYCRVSSRDQNPELQLDALDAHGYDRLFAEKESGKRGVERREFTAALSALQPGETLVFWKSDRWGRSAAHVLTTIGELRDRGVTVKSLTENFDLDTKLPVVRTRTRSGPEALARPFAQTAEGVPDIWL
jgi:DNA invertase Pin-like site-specific DNA recombinase